MRLVSTRNQSNLAKNWLEYISNRRILSTSVKNGTFLLAIVAIGRVAVVVVTPRAHAQGG